MGRVRQVRPTSYLLDTHVLLWSLNNDPRLSRHHFDIIEAKENLTVSVVSIWEIAIKRSLGKLTTQDDLLGNITRRPIRILPIDEVHALETDYAPPSRSIRSNANLTSAGGGVDDPDVRQALRAL